jgi:hypothetical protein
MRIAILILCASALMAADLPDGPREHFTLRDGRAFDGVYLAAKQQLHALIGGSASGKATVAVLPVAPSDIVTRTVIADAPPPALPPETRAALDAIAAERTRTESELAARAAERDAKIAAMQNEQQQRARAATRAQQYRALGYDFNPATQTADAMDAIVKADEARKQAAFDAKNAADDERNRAEEMARRREAASAIPGKDAIQPTEDIPNSAIDASEWDRSLEQSQQQLKQELAQRIAEQRRRDDEAHARMVRWIVIAWSLATAIWLIPVVVAWRRRHPYRMPIYAAALATPPAAFALAASDMTKPVPVVLMTVGWLAMLIWSVMPISAPKNTMPQQTD